MSESGGEAEKRPKLHKVVFVAEVRMKTSASEAEEMAMGEIWIEERVG